MSQYDVSGFAVEIVFEKLRDTVVGQVPAPAHDPLLQGPGIGAGFEHLNIVVGFQDDAVTPLQSLQHEVGDIPQIQGDPDLNAVLLNDEAERIGGIVRG